jgi:hypothetical protein
MPKVKDKDREYRILMEVIPDCKDEEDIANSWYYYLAENLKFPIPAKVKLRMRGGKSEKVIIEIVEIESGCEHSAKLKVGIVEKGSKRVQFIDIQSITNIQTSPANLEIINDWLYWHHFDLLQEQNDSL